MSWLGEVEVRLPTIAALLQKIVTNASLRASISPSWPTLVIHLSGVL